MNHIVLLDKAFAPVCMPVDGYRSVVWSLRYQEPGTFSAVMPYADVRDAIERAEYLAYGAYCGRIERCTASEGELALRGRTLECLLYDRLVARKFTYTGCVADACYSLVTAACADMPLVIDRDGAAFPETGTFGGEWRSAGALLRDMLSPYGASYAVAYVPGETKCAFRLTRGTDKSSAGAVFSEDFGNIAHLTLEWDRSDLVDRLYVTGNDGTTVSVTREGAVVPYRDARITAKELAPADYEVFADYTDALEARGAAYLAENGGELLRIDGSVETGDAAGLPCALGDLCTVVSPTMGYTGTARLTEVEIVAENGVVRVYPYFGDRRMTIREAILGK